MSLPHVANFQDLVVYQKARAFQREIFQISLAFPRNETFPFTDQIRRSSRSNGANIVEKWAKRRYEKFFFSKLTDANSEQMETQHWIGTALDCGYLQAQSDALVAKCKELGCLLGGMIQRADTCWDESKSLHESAAEYFTGTTDLLSD